jgi:hypothetical protein
MGLGTRAGRTEFTFDTPAIKENGFGAVWLTDDPHGPVAAFIELPPNLEAPAHSHPVDQITVVVEGSLRVGRTWYEAGSVRVQEKGSVYGPSLTGPEGLRVIVFVADRHGLPDDFAREEDRVEQAENMRRLLEFSVAGGALPFPGFGMPAEEVTVP